MAPDPMPADDVRPTPDDLALLTTSADYWSTRALPGLGLRGFRMSDGPHGASAPV